MMGVSMQMGSPAKGDVTEAARLFVVLVNASSPFPPSSSAAPPTPHPPPLSSPPRLENISTFEEQQRLFFRGHKNGVIRPG